MFWTEAQFTPSTDFCQLHSPAPVEDLRLLNTAASPARQCIFNLSFMTRLAGCSCPEVSFKPEVKDWKDTHLFTRQPAVSQISKTSSAISKVFFVPKCSL